MAKVVIVGQGYVGLPISMAAVDAGHLVIGLDSSAERIKSLKNGVSFVEDVGATELQSALKTNRYVPTEDYAETSNFDVCVITVPTPLKDSLPDLSFIEASAHSIAPFVTPGCLVILESTTYPGTTEEILVPALERGSGLKPGTEFSVGYSPERIDPGNKHWNFRNTPKVTAGLTQNCARRVSDFYLSMIDTTVPVKSCKEAELTKLLENTFRHVNIALVNELAVYSNQLGIDVWNAIEAAATKPFGFMKFTPGPGVGGHCLPIDPSYLSWRVRQSLGRPFRFIDLANDINENMPHYVVSRLVHLLNDQSQAMRNSRLLLLGMTYKKNSSDARESPAVRVAEILIELGADLEIIDPWVSVTPKSLEGKVKLSSNFDPIVRYDAAVLLTDHDSIDYEQIVKGSFPILDTKRCLPDSPNVVTL